MVFFLTFAKIFKNNKMKKFVLSVAAVLTIGFANAQEKAKNTSDVSYGVKAGLNLANIVGDDAGDANMYVGFNAGLFVEIPVADKLSIQPELLYSTQGSKAEENIEGYNFDLTMKLNYINVPVMFKYKVADKFSLEAGPYVGFLANSKIKYKSSIVSGSEDMDDLLKSTDFGLGFGMNYELSDIVFANARYQAGLTQIGDTGEGDDIKNSVFQIGLGIRF
ncbi:hypothetical protein FLJC2902T_18170 [Flavobacterium limnosediminis JC2902]|uniref:Outer membrane protein beta-barrel domain-containing protein n=2 Tax=Flavobacterium TaxID=237 RepID=V6SPS1_9FLAO|nr:hypothetical protein FLJC2902T_18170 [Flavobacterium limnosediminis JC2902]